VSDGYHLKYISLGAGLQSTCLLMMACTGDNGCGPADVAIFADVAGDEPAWVYETLEWCKKNSSIPIEVVSKASLSKQIADKKAGKPGRVAMPPLFMEHGGFTRRQCTRELKIEVIEKRVREIMGYEPRQRIKEKAQAWLGISLDEAHRMKPSRQPWINNRWPLIDARMRSSDCVRYMEEKGWPVPGKSSCVFCPYHSDRYYRELRDNHPGEFARAVAFDDMVREMPGLDEKAYVHRSLRPLSEIKFEHEDQIELFGEECSGHCGI